MKTSKELCLAHLCNDLNNQYSTGVLRGVLHAVDELDISVVVFGVGTLEDRVLSSRMRNRLLSLVNPNDFDGIIHTTSSVSSFAGIEHYQKATRHFGGIPAVHIGAGVPGHMSFTIDNEAVMYEVTDHVIKAHGRRKIAFIYGGKGGQESDARYRGYRQALEENGIDCDERYVYEGFFLRQGGIEAIHEFLDVRKIALDAVIASNDNMALYALKELRRRGYRVPEDVSVTGFDDTEIAMSHDPALTTVHQPLGKLGYGCVRRFVEALRSGSLTPAEHRMEAHLVLRESCGCVDSPENDYGMETEINQQYVISPSQKTEQDVVIHNMSRNIIGTFNEEEIRSALDDSLRLFEIEDFSLARYADDENSVVFYSLAGDRGQVFPSNRLVHRGIDSIPRPFTRFVLPLHFRNENIGFFVSDKGAMDMSVLEVVRDHISGALKGAALIEDVRAYAAGLEEMVRERTSELESALDRVQAVSDKLERLAVLDELTGLYNRRGFLSVAGKQVERLKRRPQEVVLVYLDLDDLKKINDTYGHEAGDEALKAIAHILVRVFRKTDIVARFGGDEFTVLAIDCSIAEYERISRRLDDYVGDYNETSGNRFKLSITHGAAPYRNANGASLEQLMREADRELYELKRVKKSQNDGRENM